MDLGSPKDVRERFNARSEIRARGAGSIARPCRCARNACASSCSVGLLVIDLLCIVGGFLVANALRFGDPVATAGLTMLEVIGTLYVAIALNNQAYAYTALVDAAFQHCAVGVALLWSAIAVIFIGFYLQASDQYSRLTFSCGSRPA
jgi:hypothetical protein